MKSPHNPREIVIVAFPGVQSLDISGPFEVFSGARELLAREGDGRRGYRVTILSRDGSPLQSSSGLTLTPHASLSSAPAGIDTLIVAGGPGCRAAAEDGGLIDWLSATAPATRRTASVCTGAFLLARAGLLSGRRATTHWSAADALARMYPDVRVDPDPVYVHDGPIWTSAGVTAGMDLALALVEEDLDSESALTIARHLVLFLRRPGSQSQFSAALSARQPRREPLREVQRHVVEHPQSDLSVAAMARRAHMSPRHFARAFVAETGVTPACYVEQVRLEAARRLLEGSAAPVSEVAAECGFGTAETMRRTFLRALDVGPAEYRRRFQAGGARRRAA